MFHTEFFKGKSLQEVNGSSMEGAVLNIIIDGELDERERECLCVCVYIQLINVNVNKYILLYLSCLDLFQISIPNLHKQDLLIYLI